MSHNNPDNAMQIQQQANEWLVRQNGGFSADEQRRLEAWLQQDEAHQQAWQLAQQAWQLSALLADDAELCQPVAAQQQTVAAVKASHWPGLLSAANGTRLLLSVILLLGLWNFVPLQQGWLQLQADYYTSDGQTQQITLSDGSQVHLSGKSAVTINYSQNVRRIELLSGEAIFYPTAISQSESRPFQVISDQHQVEALGTIFYVRHADETEVAVLEHSVRVSDINSGYFTDAVVSEGEHGVAGEKQFDFSPPDSDIQQAISWRKGRLVFKQKTPAEIIARLNQFYPGKIIIISDIDKNKRLTAVFQLNNIDQAVTTLAAELGLKQQSALGYQLLY